MNMSDEKNKLKDSIPFIDPKNQIPVSAGWQSLGKTAGGHDIMAKELQAEGEARGNILLIGGVHGNETEGVAFMKGFCDEFGENKSTYPNFNLFLIPVLNADGFLSFKRSNANKVDLNRNLPTKDWTNEHTEEKYFPGPKAGSEPESEILLQVLDKFKPDYIISFHSWKPMININGPARPFGEKMQEKMDMIITEDIGYPTPGSLGTYAGWEREIPTITLEFERGLPLENIYSYARDAILNSFEVL